MTDEFKSDLLETELIRICTALGECNNLTGNKGIDFEYLIGIVGSYLIGIKEGTLDEDVRPPRELFIEGLYPNIKDLEVVKEVIEDGDGEDSVIDAELDGQPDTA